MPRVCIIDFPGLSRALLRHIPATTALGRWMAAQPVAPLLPSFPAVTCSVQATLTTGTPPSRHGIIANGLPAFRSSADADLTDPANFTEYRRTVSFWEQSNPLLESPRFWQDTAGRSRIPTALLFFQNSMPGFTGTLRPAADIVLTPKPDHGPDGKLVSLCWSNPPELVPQLFQSLGPFPLMNYWGPMAGLPVSQWIANAATMVWQTRAPQLQLVYVPHLDYDLQRFGPNSPAAAKAVADVATAVEPLVSAVLDAGARLVVLSEYAMTDVHRSIAINQILRRAGLLRTRSAPDGQLIDYAASDAFAMVDHQIAHVYTRWPQATAHVREVLVDQPLELADRTAQEDRGINHRRSGDLIAVAAPDAWFDYRWWTDPAEAPLFARTVDIHRKPGYDPLELFLDPAARAITQDASLIRGSHGRVDAPDAVLIGADIDSPQKATDVAPRIASMLGL